MRMTEFASESRSGTRPGIHDAATRTHERQEHWRVSAVVAPEKGPYALPWRWTVLIITVLSAIVWIGILFGVITVLDHL